MAAATINQGRTKDKAPIVDDLSSRMVMVETQMMGFDHRMSSVENKLDDVLGKLGQFIVATNKVADRPAFDPQRVLQFLLTGAALLGIVASSIVYIAKSQNAERVSAIETIQLEHTKQIAFLERSYVQDLKDEVTEWRKRYSWRAELTTSTR